MKIKSSQIILFFCFLIVLSSCESNDQRQEREAKEEQNRIERIEKSRQEAEKLAFTNEQNRLEQEKYKEEQRIEREAREENERAEKAIYDRYINNSLNTGAKPYAYCFGSDNSCSNYGCSQINVRTPANSDVLVTIKKYKEVYRHAYIAAGSQYTFNLPNGNYQAFFYYGKGWNPNKIMKVVDCGTLKGGFLTHEHFGKDSPISLKDEVLSYELILQQNGNFSTTPSNSEEAF